MGLASEFQRKQQLEARQFQAQQPSTGPKEHPEDTLIVRNILVGDDTDIEDVIPYANARPGTDPVTGQPHFVNQIDTNQFEHTWNTRDFFEVRWDGRPHRIRPGETRRMPRYLADHFAKYLIDFMLAAREEREKLTGLVKNRLARKQLYEQIIVGVDSYYNGDLYDYQREGNFVEEQVTKLNSNQGGSAHDLGMVPNVALGYGTTDKPPESSVIPDLEHSTAPLAGDPLLAAPESAPAAPKTQEDLIKTKSINELRAEAKQLGVQVTNSMTKDQLAAAVLSF